MSLSPSALTRRSLLKTTAIGLVMGVSLPVPLFARSAEPPPLADYKPEYFTAQEWAFVMAATARLIPSDGTGPGALETRVPVFIDRQLAGAYGIAADWYMEGPFDPAANPQLGFQSPLTPAEIYRQGIALFDGWCRQALGSPFAALAPERQDQALKLLEKNALAAGKPPAGATPAEAGPLVPPELRDFFTLLLANTKEGYFADPKYGGNHAMQAWVYIGFPGARASYAEWATRQNVRYPLGPVSISGERA